MKNRKDELPKRYFRTERVQQANGVWFFLTRESPQEGPFSRKEDALQALQRHVAVWRCKLFSNAEYARINSIGLQTEIASRSRSAAANDSLHDFAWSRKAQEK